MSLSADTVQLADVARRFRLVKEAYRDFLTRWAVERLVDDAAAMRHLADDLDVTLEGETSPAAGPRMKNPYETGWTGLYRGPDLDD